MSSIPESKKPVPTILPRHLDYFKQNYPIHHTILLDLIARGELVLEGGAS